MIKTAGVIGLGYVGLPLAVELCRAGITVVGVDVDEKRVDSLRAGKSHISDVSDETVDALVNEGLLYVTTEYKKLSCVEAVSICVPTPLHKTKDPDITFVTSVAENLAKVLRPGQLVILESTVFPGATEEIVAPRLEESGLIAGRDFWLAFSPERIDPGNREFQVAQIPKLIGGINQCSSYKAAEYYSQIFPNITCVNSAKEAEMAKLLENTFRAVNIGLVNELAVLANQMGVNIWNVIDAAATKPFGFMPFYPGPGWGGHCIPVDPIYLSWKAKSRGGEAGFIDHAVLVNNRMPTYVVSRVTDMLNEKGLALRGAKVLLVGVAYKRDVADVRESPALEILSIVDRKGADVTYHDPFVPFIDNIDGWWQSQPLNEDMLRAQDCVIISTDHTGVDYEMIARHSSNVFDTRNAMKQYRSEYESVHVL